MTQLLAYLDPDSGSMLLQLLAGGLAGAGVFLRYQWRIISTFVLGFVGRKRAAPVTTVSTEASIEVA